MLPARRLLDQLRERVHELTAVPRADGVTAMEFATALAACYPKHKWTDEGIQATYLRQVAACCAGETLEVLEAMLNPKIGLVGDKTYGLPDICDVQQWIEARNQPVASELARLFERIAELEAKEKEQPATTEEREAGLARWRELKKQIGELRSE